jgi:aspartate/methionine/tyrosine aminotransferase
MMRAVDAVLDAVTAHPDPEPSFVVGSPWFDPPATIVQALAEAARGSHHGYPPPQGLFELRTALTQVHDRQGLTLSPEQVVITHGAKSGLLAVLGTLLEPGDEILHPVPCYPAYRAAPIALGAQPVAVSLSARRSGWDPETLGSHITPRTRALVLSSPANPDGVTLRSDEARELVAFCRNRGLRLVCDEPYEAFRFAPDCDRSPAHWDPALETVIQIRSFSKTYALCGWRIGYVAANPDLVRRVTAWQSALLNPPNSFAQQALIVVPQVPDGFATEAHRQVRQRLEELLEVAVGAGLETDMPEGGFYLWANVEKQLAASGYPDTRSWCVELARQQGIGLWPGEDFFAPGWVRLSAVACPEARWSSALERLAEALRSFVNGGSG